MAEATEAQKRNLENARNERNKHQALLTHVQELEARIEAYKQLGVIFHDDSFSYTLNAEHVNKLRNLWPEFFTKTEELFGPSQYRP